MERSISVTLNMTCATSMISITVLPKANCRSVARWRFARDDPRRASTLVERLYDAAVDLDRGARDVCGALGSQERHQITELLGLSEAADGNLPGALPVGFLHRDAFLR